MRLRYVELLHAVLVTGSVTGAANLLNISQPAASKALQQAERQLGFALFNRVRGRLRATPQAALLRQRIEKIMQELHDLERLSANIGPPENYPLRVTSTPALAHALVPDAIARLHEDFAPGTSIELFTQHSDVMRKSLMLHETDIGLTLQDNSQPDLQHEPLYHAEIMAIAPRGWWKDSELSKPLPLAALAGQPMIGINVRDALGTMLQSHLAQVDPPPRISIRVQTYELAHALVAAGQGLALVDPFTAQRADEYVVQTRPLKLRLDVALYAIYRMDSPLNPVQERFLGLIRKLAPQTLKHH